MTEITDEERAVARAINQFAIFDNDTQLFDCARAAIAASHAYAFAAFAAFDVPARRPLPAPPTESE